MAEATQKTCKKKRSSKDRMTAERTTAKNKLRRQRRHDRRVAIKDIHRRDWARRNGVGEVDINRSAKELRTLVWLLRNDLIFAEGYRGQ